MNENIYRKWSIIIQLLTALGIIVGGAIGLWRYFDTTAKQFQKPLWDRQIALYFELSEVAAVLGSAKARDEWTAAKFRFFTLINGPLIIVMDNQVQLSITEFANKLINVNNENLEKSWHDPLARTPLEKNSQKLSYDIRNALDRAMNLNRPAIKDDPKDWNR